MQIFYVKKLDNNMVIRFYTRESLKKLDVLWILYKFYLRYYLAVASLYVLQRNLKLSLRNIGELPILWISDLSIVWRKFNVY